jgi:Domain of unknown function (DUF4234)
VLEVKRKNKLVGSSSHTIEQRDLGKVAILSIVTLGIYGILLMAKWTDDVNFLLKREKHEKIVVVIVGVVTLGIALAIWEIIFAYDIQSYTESERLGERNKNLGGTVLGLTLFAYALAFASGGLAFVLSMAVGVYASCLVQKELNMIADELNAS